MAAVREKTYLAKPGEVERKWLILDAEEKVLGKLAVKAAFILQGKHKPQYTPYIDVGDFIIVTNAKKIRVSGKKRSQKIYKRYTGYIGGLRQIPFEKVQQRHPERIIEQAVRRMLPKTRLGRQMFRKLKVYAGPEHPHVAQQPVLWNPE